MKTTDLVSIGYAAQLLQAVPKRIREAAQALGIQPACRINGIDHYSEDDVQKIRKQIIANINGAN